MAGESVVGALRVVLGLDTVEFEDGLDKTGGLLEKFLGKFGKAVGVTAAIGAFTAIAASVYKTSESMDELGKTAQKVGVSVEQFSALKYAANLADVQTEQLASSMEKLGRNMSAVAGGAKGPAKDAFDALGISLKDASGNLKSSSDVLGELSDKFAGFKDSAAKTALAIAIFGKAGAEMIPLLNQGKAGLASAADEAKRFGLIVSDEAAKAANEFNDNLKRLSSILAGIMLQSTAAVSGEMTNLSKTMLLIANNSGGITVAVSTLSTILNVLLGVVNLLLVAFDKITANFKLFAQAAYAIATGDFAKLPELFQQYTDNLKSAGQQAVDTAKSVLGLGQSFTFAGNAIGSFNQFAGQIKADAPVLKTKDAIDHFIESANKAVAAQQAEVLGFGLSADAAAALKIRLEALAVAKNEHLTIDAKQQKQLSDLQVTAGQYALALQGQQILLQNLSPWEAYNLELQKNVALLTQGALGQEKMALVGMKAAAQLQAAYAQAAVSIVGDMANAFRDLAAVNKQYAGIAKAFAIGQAIASTYLAANNAYANTVLIGGPILAAVAAAAAVAAGLANVAKISATPFASGGSFTVGGGRGFTDTQMVNLALTPGEMVDVRRTGQQSGAVDINLSGVGAEDFFTGKMLRGLVDALNQGHRDGYRLKIAS